MKSLVVGYSDKDSVRPGERIDFKVSCEHAKTFRADIVRLISPDTGPGGPGFKEEEIGTEVDAEYAARSQTINIGSYVRIPTKGKIQGLSSFTLQAVVWPTRPGSGVQALLGTWMDGGRNGFALGLDESGALMLVIGDGANSDHISTGNPLTERRWYLVAATFDAATHIAQVHQSPISDRKISFEEKVTAERALSCAPSGEPGDFLIAAWNGSERTGRCTAAHYNGKIDRPCLMSRVLSWEEIEAAVHEPMRETVRSALVAAWDFSTDISSDRIIDNGPHALHGTAVNLPTRGVTGFNWSGREWCWRHVPGEYGAIHFHSDDLYDAQWETDFSLAVSSDMKSGVYAARLRAGAAEFYVPFYVRPPLNRRTADTLFVVPTATYLAYANNRVRIVSPVTDYLIGKLTVVDETDLLILERPEVGLSTYDPHRDGSPVCYSSRLRPVTNHRPKDADLSMAYNNFAADLLIVDWLEHSGIPYDVITDEDLHYERMRALEGYRVIVTGTHPEYYSCEMLDGLTDFTRAGGRLMYLGGNGFYWRVAFREDKPGALELRRAQVNIARWNPGPGQYFHSFTGEHGGLWRDLGRPPQSLVGVGFIAQGFDCSSHYRRADCASDPRVAFMFEGIEDDILGDFGLMRGGASGVEIDRCDPRLGTPSHALVVAFSEDHTNVYEVFEEVFPMGEAGNHAGRPEVRADMTFFECPGGGGVFSVGSIAYAGSFSHNGYDNNINRLTTNVLRRFLDPTPFSMPRNP